MSLRVVRSDKARLNKIYGSWYNSFHKSTVDIDLLSVSKFMALYHKREVLTLHLFCTIASELILQIFRQRKHKHILNCHVMDIYDVH